MDILLVDDNPDTTKPMPHPIGDLLKGHRAFNFFAIFATSRE